MGTLPALPALLVKTPEQPDPVSSIGRLLAIKSMLGQQKMQDVELQNAQIGQRDQQATTQALRDWDGKNYNDLPSLVLKNGGSANAVFGATQHILDRQQKISEIAKADAATNASNLESVQKQNDQYRGRLQAIINAPDASKQSLWDAEITKEEQAGTIKPGQVSHQYPGDDQATYHANSFALGSVLASEAIKNRDASNGAWKPLNGQLVNTATGEKIGANLNVASLNKALETRYQVLNPGKSLPPQFTLQSGASPEDFSRIDKVLEATEKSQGTKAQQDTANAIRSQTFEMARDKSDMKPVTGLDPKTGNQVLVPAGQAQQMGIQNPMQADADMVNKAMAGRHWLSLATKPAPAGADPQDMSITQLVDKLDKAGKLGPLASRWNEFMTGTWGGGDPVVSALRAKMGLSTTLLMQAHVGNRGSAQMLEHFEDLANQKKLDGPTLKAAFGSEINYVRDRAMDPNPPNYSAQGGGASTTGAAPGNAGQIQVKDPQGGIHTFADQASADKFKKLAGIR
jgi:hypothetical protein